MNLDINKFHSFWKQNFPNCPPVSWLFKWRLEERWFRFHSLPESKRYADDANEIAELLRRQNIALLDIIGTEKECVLVSGNYDDSSFEVNKTDCSALDYFQLQEFMRLSKQDFDPEDLEPHEEPTYLSLFCSMHKLKPGSLDDVLLCVANEQIYNFFVVSCEHGRIFAPYDGGVDVILENTEERDEFKAKYKDWLSLHPSGL